MELLRTHPEVGLGVTRAPVEVRLKVTRTPVEVRLELLRSHPEVRLELKQTPAEVPEVGVFANLVCSHTPLESKVEVMWPVSDFRTTSYRILVSTHNYLEPSLCHRLRSDHLPSIGCCGEGQLSVSSPQSGMHLNSILKFKIYKRRVPKP